MLRMSTSECLQRQSEPHLICMHPSRPPYKLESFARQSSLRSLLSPVGVEHSPSNPFAPIFQVYVFNVRLPSISVNPIHSHHRFPRAPNTNFNILLSLTRSSPLLSPFIPLIAMWTGSNRHSFLTSLCPYQRPGPLILPHSDSVYYLSLTA